MSNESNVNNPKVLPKPAKILDRTASVKGMLMEYELQEGKFTKQSVQLTVRDKEDQDFIVHIGVTGGDQYQQLYDILQANVMPIPIDISVSDAYEGRTIKLLKGALKPKT